MSDYTEKTGGKDPAGGGGAGTGGRPIGPWQLRASIFLSLQVQQIQISAPFASTREDDAVAFVRNVKGNVKGNFLWRAWASVTLRTGSEYDRAAKKDESSQHA